MRVGLIRNKFISTKQIDKRIDRLCLNTIAEQVHSPALAMYVLDFQCVTPMLKRRLGSNSRSHFGKMTPVFTVHGCQKRQP